VKFPSEPPAETVWQVGRGGCFHRYKEGDIGLQFLYSGMSGPCQIGWYRGKMTFRPRGWKVFLFSEGTYSRILPSGLSGQIGWYHEQYNLVPLVDGVFYLRGWWAGGQLLYRRVKPLPIGDNRRINFWRGLYVLGCRNGMYAPGGTRPA
jgi:hypothetical protein